MTLGEKINKLRKENNLTQEQLADILHVSRQSISKWESDTAYPETDKIIEIGKFFGCSMDYLLNDDHTENKPAEEEKSGNFNTVLTKKNLNILKWVLIVLGVIFATLFIFFIINFFIPILDVFKQMYNSNKEFQNMDLILNFHNMLS